MIKKLQVFVSSTYNDLLEERQAAVEAILDSGHIPAGMELFKPEDKSQIDTIKRWIEGSDIFMLILGARYGSIEPESQKSYIELEYLHAIQKKIPFFALVIDDEGIKQKISKLGEQNVVEQENTKQFNDFKKLVLSKTCRKFCDPKDIKINFLSTILELNQKDKLIGWIRSDEAISFHNMPLMNNTSELRKVIRKTFEHKDYKVNQKISDDLCIIAMINLSNIEQKFHLYFYFLSDNSKGRWIGYTNDPNTGMGDDIENTQDVLLENTYHFMIFDNIKKTIKERFPGIQEHPTIIEKIRVRGDKEITQPINFFYAFIDKK